MILVSFTVRRRPGRRGVILAAKHRAHDAQRPIVPRAPLAMIAPVRHARRPIEAVPADDDVRVEEIVAVGERAQAGDHFVAEEVDAGSNRTSSLNAPAANRKWSEAKSAGTGARSVRWRGIG